MLTTEEAAALIRQHKAKYPAMEIQDAIKLLYQSEFGPAHAITDEAAARARLFSELRSAGESDAEPLTVPIGGGYSRVNLRALKKYGADPEKLAEIFIKSAAPAGDKTRFSELLLSLAETDGLPFDKGEFAGCAARYAAAGCPAVHHSRAYGEAFSPAYRVVRTELVPELFSGK